MRTCLPWIFLLAAGAAAQPPSLEPLADGLYLYRDAANVYVLRHGTHAVLIDFGGGGVLDALAAAGIEQVDAVYLTHRDRDQWSGLERAAARGIPIHAPAGPEMPRFPDLLPLASSRFFEVYSVPPEAGAARATVRDGATFETAAGTLRALATPGHTVDHVVYVATAGGRKLAFTGDLIYAPGKVWRGYQLDWDHWLPTGHEAAVRSLLALRDQHPAMLLPSHGEVLRESVEDALTFTADRVWQAARAKNFELFAMSQTPVLGATTPLRRLETVEVSAPGARPVTLQRLSKHLWLTGNNYFIVADNGACFAVDNNLPPAMWKPILARIGASKVDYLWITHLHSDHTRELPALTKLYGMKVLAVRELADALENPRAWLHPYAAFDGIRPGRVLEDKEEFEWNGYRFRAHFAPGQTWFHAFLETVIDGRRAVFSGDSFYPVKDFDRANGTGGWSGLNRGFPLYHVRSARLMLDIHPDWVLAEHNMPFLFDVREWNGRVRWAREAGAALDALSPSGNHLWDFNPHVFSPYPFLSRGETGAVELRVLNPFGEPMQFSWRVAPGAPAEVEPSGGSAVVPAGSTRAVPLRYRLRGAASRGRHVVPVEVTARGSYLGEACVFVVEVP